jgi:hypothetical protein
MSPRRPRRRARRRSPARPIILLIAVVIGLALLVGGLSQVSRQSQGYDSDSNRALAAQGAVVAAQSNATASQVRTLLRGLQGQTRQGLQVGLDSAVQQSATEAARAKLAAISNPAGQMAAAFAAVFAQRAQSMSELRAAVDGFLGMQPILPAGSPSHGATPAIATVSLSATQATNRIASAGALLSHADALYRSVRRSMASTAGHGRLPASVWVTDPQLWQVGSVAAQVDLIAASPTLVSAHNVVLRTVRLSPPALPTPQGVPANVSVLSPGSQIGVTVVLANQGSVDEPHASVRYTLANQSSGTTATQAESAALTLGASVTLPQVSFNVVPGTTYMLTVEVLLPAGQTQTANTVLQQALQVAPAS